MKFSVIIPVYNCENYIADCLDSILLQNYENLEIIIVNDGSTDNSKKIIEDYSAKDNRIKVFHNRNFGVSYSRNFGIRYATGDYIHFVDADDKVVDGLYDFANQLLFDNNYDFIRFDYIFDNNGCYYENNEEKYKFDTEVDKDSIYFKLIPKILDEKIKAYVWQIIIKNNIVPEFDNDLMILEDEKFTLEILSKSTKGFITNKVYYYYNISNLNSATKSMTKIKTMMKNSLFANKVIKKTLSKYKIDSSTNLEILDSRMAHSFSNYLEILFVNYGNFNNSLNIFKECIQNINLKEHFKFLNYKNLCFKHRITTFLSFNKQYFLLFIIYKLKNIIK